MSRPRRRRSSVQSSLPVTINLNTILTAVIGGAVLFSVQRGCSKSDEAAKVQEATQMKVELVNKDVTNVQSSVSAVQQDVKEIRSTAITRPELENKHTALKQAIEKVSDRQEKLQDKLNQRESIGSPPDVMGHMPDWKPKP